MLREGLVGPVDQHGPPAFAPRQLREADVIGVAVGEDDCPDVLEAAAHRRELGREQPPQAGGAGVDDRDLAGVLDQVGIDDAVRTHAVDPRRDLHQGIPGNAASVAAGSSSAPSAMELAGAFRLGGDVDAAFAYDADRLTDAITAAGRHGST